MDNTFLVTTFTGVSNVGSIILNILFIKQVWFSRVQISEVLSLTRIELPGIKRRIYTILVFTEKIGLVVALVMLFYANCLSELNFGTDGYVKNNTSLRYSWIILKAYAITAIMSVRLQVLSMIVALLLLYLNLNHELDHINCNIKRGTEIFRLLRWKMDIINEYFVNQILAWYLVVVAFYCKVPEIVMSPLFTQSKLFMFVYMTCDSIGWLTAAEYYHLVQKTFLRWLWNHDYNYSGYRSREKVIEMIQPTNESVDEGTVKAEFHLEYLALSTRFFRVTWIFGGCKYHNFTFTYIKVRQQANFLK